MSRAVRRARPIAALAVVWLLATAADAPRARLLVIGPDEEPRFSEIVRGLREGLGAQGHAPGSVDVQEVRLPRGDTSSVPAIVDEALRTRTRAVFTIGSVLAEVVRRASPGLPIVFITPGDPVAAGIVETFRRPGRNMTAMMFEYPELSAKRVELLKQLAPRARRIMVLHDPGDPSPRQGFEAATAIASRLGVAVVGAPVRRADGLRVAWETAGPVDGAVLVPGGVGTAVAGEAVKLALARRVPLVGTTDRDARAGALATYGASDVDVARDAARLVDQIFRGAQAGELPVERPTKLRLLVNRHTARALGLTIPDAVLARADEVLESSR